MLIPDAQRDVRSLYLGGAIGQAVSALVWLLSAALATWVSPNAGTIALIFGGIFIFPLTTLAIRLTGRKSALDRAHPMNALAMQTAFIAPLLIPLILAASSSNPNWFYPGFMIAVGVHYLPFIFLYGMWQFGVLAAVLFSAGTALLYLDTFTFTTGAWFTSAVLFVFAILIAVTKPWKR
jgi:hypothetical protein